MKRNTRVIIHRVAILLVLVTLISAVIEYTIHSKSDLKNYTGEGSVFNLPDQKQNSGKSYKDSNQTQVNVTESQDIRELQNLTAESAFLMDETTGKEIYSVNPNRRMYPASTTKIMTALLAVENGNLNDVITVGEEANLAEVDASKAGLDFNEKIPLKTLLKGLLLPSGNDAAYVLAVYTARKVSGQKDMSIHDAVAYFCRMMNERAKELGAHDTSFVNPDGYHDPQHYTTTHDLGLIAREAMKSKYLRDVVKTSEFSMKDWSSFDKSSKAKNRQRLWQNTNKLIVPDSGYYFKYATGLKTGHTTQAGYCLVSSAALNGKSVIAVVMKDTEQAEWGDSTKLLEYGLNH
ncbi:MAG: D-alanyl-D-alanine carboxypeptidase [Bacillota bacterium]|nr:D-alanyl-D-alanine carboxypeptidase [Bacillota bacterium]